MQLLYDTFGLRSNIWDYTGEASPKGKVVPANTVKTCGELIGFVEPSFLALTLDKR